MDLEELYDLCVHGLDAGSGVSRQKIKPYIGQLQITGFMADNTVYKNSDLSLCIFHLSVEVFKPVLE